MNTRPCNSCHLIQAVHVQNTWLGNLYYDCPIYFENDPQWPEMIYKPMDNLEYLEWLSNGRN